MMSIFSASGGEGEEGEGGRRGGGGGGFGLEKWMKGLEEVIFCG